MRGRGRSVSESERSRPSDEGMSGAAVKADQWTTWRSSRIVDADMAPTSRCSPRRPRSRHKRPRERAATPRAACRSTRASLARAGGSRRADVRLIGSCGSARTWSIPGRPKRGWSRQVGSGVGACARVAWTGWPASVGLVGRLAPDGLRPFGLGGVCLHPVDSHVFDRRPGRYGRLEVTQSRSNRRARDSDCADVDPHVVRPRSPGAAVRASNPVGG